MKLSILDQSPVSSGKTAQEALNASVELAKRGDELGYTRYWIAEHHDMAGLACPNPNVLLGIIGSQTKRIRIGAGAVLLPHYRPYRVAETYNLLSTLYPGRIDLGIGRAPGGSAETAIALSGNYLENVRQMPVSIDELLHFLRQDFPEENLYHKVTPSPVPNNLPEPWMLGTSIKSAVAAADKGLPYTFGHFMSDEDGPAVMEQYTQQLTEKYPDATPQKIVAVSVICAETTQVAEDLALSNQLWRIQRDKGEGDGKIPTVQEAYDYTYSKEDREKMQRMADSTIIGNPQKVKEQLEQLQALYDVDEWMILTVVHSYEARQKSYELIAKEIL